MILRQLFDHETYTYTYLIVTEANGLCALIDPVLGQVDAYLRLLNELNLNLVMALDTHVHADHITALGSLRELTNCKTYVGLENEVACSDYPLKDGVALSFGNLVLEVIYTPGHTDNSFCYYMQHKEQGYIFTGDTLLIRGTGRTDFQNGDSTQLYHSLHEKLLKLPGDTIVYPGHDYKGWTQSTIMEEKAHNPRLQLHPVAQFVDHMANLNLASPKFMDVAVPANLTCGVIKDKS